MTTPREHGGPVAAELQSLGLAPGEVLDFSVNVNVYGPAPAMIEAIRAARVDRYPDPTARAAREALGGACGVDPERIVIGNGAADLLWTLARVLVHPGQTVLVVEPAFSELRAAAATAGARVVEWRASPENNFAVDLDEVAARVRASEARTLYLCAPTTPSGAAVPAADIAVLSQTLPGVSMILDEAFLSLSERYADAMVPLPAGVIRVRSLTKEHGIPGVRVGYAITTPAIAAAVEAMRPAWTTGAANQAAAVASCGLDRFVADSRERLLADRRALVAGLRELGLSPLPSSTIFCAVPIGDAATLRSALLARHRILVRDCASFGMPGYLRVAARPRADRERLLSALREELDR